MRIVFLLFLYLLVTVSTPTNAGGDDKELGDVEILDAIDESLSYKKMPEPVDVATAGKKVKKNNTADTSIEPYDIQELLDIIYVDTIINTNKAKKTQARQIVKPVFNKIIVGTVKPINKEPIVAVEATDQYAEPQTVEATDQYAEPQTVETTDQYAESQIKPQVSTVNTAVAKESPVAKENKLVAEQTDDKDYDSCTDMFTSNDVLTKYTCMLVIGLFIVL